MDEQNNNKNNLQLARKQRRRTWWKNTPANVHGERDSEFYFIVKYIFECVCVCVCVCVEKERRILELLIQKFIIRSDCCELRVIFKRQ